VEDLLGYRLSSFPFPSIMSFSFGAGGYHVDLEHETIHLGFGEGIVPSCSMGFAWPGPGNGSRQGEGLRPDRHLPLLHGFQSADCTLPGGAVHLVARTTVGEKTGALP